ncbi:hypothetical protein CALVIDRAFT_566863 [Calocera viscosa TUFC12733]|uniref:Ribonuclease H2 subunit B n=1 Tax=Calocera viscosa (strain TUFC12733) TaxID=1330018 RepID=A0A167J1K2_CALVF|nr:hypothetical protein CALVIDRAFT_566863 [Calocera viscosa TUFC12733]
MLAHPAVIPKELLSFIEAQNSPRCIRLPHPRTGLPTLFLPLVTPPSADGRAGTTSILEVQSIAPDAKRSWFVDPGEVVSDGKLLLLAPIDPVFLLIPLLELLPEGTNARFLPFQDLLDEIANVFLHSPPTIEDNSTTVQPIEAADLAAVGEVSCSPAALRRICEVKEPAPGLEVFQFAPSKALEIVRAKVDLLSTSTTFAAFPSLERSLAKDGLALVPDKAGTDETLLSQARVKASCEIMSQYLSPVWKAKLLASYDFGRLDLHLKALADEAQAAITRADAEPKLKDATNAPNKKVKRGTVGVEKLKKANVTGMAKLSSFFTKKT